MLKSVGPTTVEHYVSGFIVKYIQCL